MPEQGFDFDNAKSGQINLTGGTYTAATGWDECETGRLTLFNRWRAYFSFDTSGLDDTAVVTAVKMNIRRRADPAGDPETYVLKFSIGTFIGSNLDGDATEWAAGTYVKSLYAKPVDKDLVDLTAAACQHINLTGDTDLKLWDDSTEGGGDPSWATAFNKDTTFRCKLSVYYTIPELGAGTGTGVGTGSGAGTVEGVLFGAGTATGVGTAIGAAVLVIPGAGTATGVGTASGSTVLWIPGAGSGTGIGTASGAAMLWLLAAGTATGVGTATADGTVIGGVAYWGEPLEGYTGGPQRGAH